MNFNSRSVTAEHLEWMTMINFYYSPVVNYYFPAEGGDSGVLR
jgi:hypothetical protein